tara:strand:+ start:123 stop:536 length:414 start_codon:yes stop_codon:yes gene_type:complete
MQQLLCTDDVFRDYLMRFDEWSVIEKGSFWVSEEVKRDTLSQMGEFLCVFLNENFDLVDMYLDPDKSQAEMQKDLTIYLSQMNGPEIFDLYQSFMTSYGVIEDLLTLEENERIGFLHALTGKGKAYFKLLNKTFSKN